MLGALNQDETTWVWAYYDEKGIMPVNRPNGPEFISVIKTGKCIPIHQCVGMVQHFLDEKYLGPQKKVHVRGAELNGM